MPNNCSLINIINIHCVNRFIRLYKLYLYVLCLSIEFAGFFEIVHFYQEKKKREIETIWSCGVRYGEKRNGTWKEERGTS